MRRDQSRLRAIAGAVIVGALVWHVGAGSVLDAVRGIDGWSLAVATALAALTTVCGAWRWVLVARGLGVDLSLRSAVAESYRSQFLNVTLPSGVLGDVRRGMRHGRNAGDLGRGLRAVLWERSAGQVVLAALTVAGVLLLPSPLRAPDLSPFALALIASATLTVAVVASATSVRVARGPSQTRSARLLRAAVTDVRAGLLGRNTWLGVVAASVLMVAGYVATFVVAAHSAGVYAPLATLVPLGLLVLMAMSVPLNVAGWGPREGAAAWAFSAASLGGAAGLGTAVVYGVLVLVAALPGAALLLIESALSDTPRLIESALSDTRPAAATTSVTAIAITAEGALHA